ncbi:receptor-type tyrosine-protein phosphatase F-like [Ornithodoros turicata]|uniref:receptor-type tyrosine-protein phosphatase F-like n=1 Tax=Ornithodoros turicata TaxID=34597 RepID=UPI003138D924
MIMPGFLWITLTMLHLTMASTDGSDCKNMISPNVINISHSEVNLQWKKAYRSSYYCICHSAVAQVGFAADFAECDAGPQWNCREVRDERPAVTAGGLMAGQEHIFCARRRCSTGVYSSGIECTAVLAPQEPGWRFTVDLIEPRRALLMWRAPDSRPFGKAPLSYTVTWCHSVGPLSSCQSKAANEDGAVISNLDAWRVYNLAVWEVLGMGAPLFHARVRTRPDNPGGPEFLNMENVGNGEVQLSWWPPEHARGPLQVYEVSWCAHTCDTHEASWVTGQSFTAPRIAYSTNYTFRVRAKNVLEDMSLEGPYASISVFTPPKDMTFHLKMNQSSSVHLSWTSNRTSQEALTVKHCYLHTAPGSCEKYFAHSPGRIFPNTEPWTMSSLEVTDSSDTILFYTTYRSPPGKSGAPTDVKVTPLNSSALLLTWSPPAEEHGPLHGYIVKWHTFYDDAEFLRIRSKTFRSFVITDVEELNTYIVEVAAYHSWHGEFLTGHMSVVYGISYSSGMNMNISTDEQGKSELRWTLRHDLVEELLITCCELGAQSDSCLRFKLPSNMRYLDIGALRPHTTYDVRFYHYEGMALILRKRFRTKERQQTSLPPLTNVKNHPSSSSTPLHIDNITCSVITGESVRVSWTDTAVNCTVHSGYSVSWQATFPPGPAHENVTLARDIVLDGLMPSARYAVLVRDLGSCAPRTWSMTFSLPSCTTRS